MDRWIKWKEENPVYHKRFLLCNVRDNNQHYEEIYAFRLAGYFSGMYWMRDAGWLEFIEDSEIGDYKVFKEIFVVTRIKDQEIETL
jgi:hypothetical protein